MGEPLSSIVSIVSFILTGLGVVVSILTLNTATQIRNRLKDKKSISNYKNEVHARIELLESADKQVPSDFKDQTKRILISCYPMVRKAKLSRYTQRVETIDTLSQSELLLLLRDFEIELDDEGV